MSEQTGRTATIAVQVELDEKNVPESIHWKASEGPPQGMSVEAMMFSVWDPERRNTLSIDLWTPRMTVDAMNFFVLQVLIKTAETFRKATGDDSTSGLLDSFVSQLQQHLETRAKTEGEGSR